MIASMTGFAAATAELPGCSLGVEMRSVNHRYLDIQLKLPDELRGLDATLRDLFTGQIRRGKVDCRVTLTHTLPGEATLASTPSGSRSFGTPPPKYGAMHRTARRSAWPTSFAGRAC